MFGFGRAKFLGVKQAAKDADDPILVTEKQLLQAFINSGLSEKSAHFQLNLSKTFNAPVMLGSKLFQLKETGDKHAIKEEIKKKRHKS